MLMKTIVPVDLIKLLVYANKSHNRPKSKLNASIDYPRLRKISSACMLDY